MTHAVAPLRGSMLFFTVPRGPLPKPRYTLGFMLSPASQVGSMFHSVASVTTFTPKYFAKNRT